ncbi:MAG: DUF3298 domain-containing protein [Pyrinomonadaceae bacterium]
MKRIVSLGITALLLGLSWASPACTRKSAPVQPANTAVSNQQTDQTGASASGGQLSDTKIFAGSIGSSNDLQMKLVRSGDDLSGTYSYVRIGKPITVKGTIDKDGNITLSEYDAGSIQTGVFKGKWDPSDPTAVKIDGTWSKPNGDQQAKFNLIEEPISFSSGWEVVTKQIKASDNKLKYDIEAQYPQISGSTEARITRFNSLTKSLVLKKISEFKKDMAERAAEDDQPPSDSDMRSDLGIGYDIALANDDLVSVGFDIGGYSRGAAHPSSFTETINYDLKNGKTLKLADLFKPSSSYLKIISAYCINDLKKQAKAQGPDSLLINDGIQNGAAAKAENYKSWTITRKGMAITFDAYQVAPYAAGPQFVLVPYSALQDTINPDGPLGQFVRTNT